MFCQTRRPIGPELYCDTAMVLSGLTRKPVDCRMFRRSSQKAPEAAADREHQGVFAHRLFRLLDRVGGGDHDRNALLPELRLRPLEGSQLLLAVGSPVSAVDQEHPSQPS